MSNMSNKLSVFFLYS